MWMQHKQKTGISKQAGMARSKVPAWKMVE